MKQIVIHKSIVREGIFGGTLTTTLCGRMNNRLKDGWNVGGKVTCKHCLNAMKQYWGQSIIKQAEEYAKKL